MGLEDLERQSAPLDLAQQRLDELQRQIHEQRTIANQNKDGPSPIAVNIIHKLEDLAQGVIAKIEALKRQSVFSVPY